MSGTARADQEHWLNNLSIYATRTPHFRAGGITRIWAYGSKAEEQPKPLSWLSKDSEVIFDEDDFFGGICIFPADRSSNICLAGDLQKCDGIELFFI